MKVAHILFTMLVSLTLTAGLQAQAIAGQGGADSLTITLDRNVMPVSIFHLGLFWTEPETVTVHDFVIRDYFGRPIDAFITQTASARTEVPIETVKEVRQAGWICKNTEDIPHIAYVVPVRMTLTDGSVLETLMNADFGTIEGTTDLGEIFVADPHTVTWLAFNRNAATAPLPEMGEEMTEEPVAGINDADGDGVLDDADLCPDTPTGVAVDEFGCPLDTDADGVADYLDKCPDTPAGATVNSIGCWVLQGINFDYNKWDIKPQFTGVLDTNVEVLNKNPGLKIEVQGHTDSIASEVYNQGLSEKRADSAKTYLTTKGIDGQRISTLGFGESHPAASNETPEGRSENRRIEIKVLSK
jgi:outer membrane protein OmpA-like peptidoglycan-associated protein